MTFVKRDANGHIIAVSPAPGPGFEEIADDDWELRSFLSNTPASSVSDGAALRERRARAADRKGDKLAAVAIRTGG
jgi:hypothetical protein